VASARVILAYNSQYMAYYSDTDDTLYEKVEKIKFDPDVPIRSVGALSGWYQYYNA